MLYIKSKEVNNLGCKTQRIVKYITAELETFSVKGIVIT